MYLYNSAQIKAWDKFTIEEENITSTDLMERAGQSLFENLCPFLLDKDATIHIFCGTGNNGGDGLVIGRLLRDQFYSVQIYECRISDHVSPDFTIMKNRLQYATNIAYKVIQNEADVPDSIKGYIIDCLLGTGLNKAVEGLALHLIEKMNNYPLLEKTFAIDVPSGLSVDKIDVGGVLKADCTLTIQNLKLPFLFERIYKYTGEVVIVDIGLSKNFNQATDFILIDMPLIKSLIIKRPKYAHKGDYGKSVFISGSPSMLGASILASKAMLKSGVGILYVSTEIENRALFQAIIPEMICLQHTELKFEEYSAIGVGPGLGVNERTVQLIEQLLKLKKALVLDADALNIIAKKKWLDQIPKDSVITPHPKEFDRLFGSHSDNYARMLTQKKISIENGIYIILKSAHTIISCPDGNVFFNATGNPGMAKGGSGDALTGLIIGLVAKMKNTRSACLIGVYLHGLAGDLAAQKYSIESFTISQMIECIDDAWLTILN